MLIRLPSTNTDRIPMSINTDTNPSPINMNMLIEFQYRVYRLLSILVIECMNHTKIRYRIMRGDLRERFFFLYLIILYSFEMKRMERMARIMPMT